MNLEQQKKILTEKMARNLGLDKITKGSYLDTLARGLFESSSKVLEELQQEFLDLSIDTASEEALDVFGAHLGAPRLKDFFITLSREGKDAIIEVTLYKNEEIITLPLYSRGQVIEGDNIELRVTEDFSYDSSIPEHNYFNGIFRINRSDYGEGLSIGEGATVPMPNPHPNIIQDIRLKILRPKMIRETPEDLGAYRKRLLALVQAKNLTGKSVVDSILKTNGVSKYYIETKGEVQTIFCLHNDMYEPGSEREDSFINKDLPVAEYLLEEVKPFGSSFTLKPCRPVDIIIDIEVKSEEVSEVMVRRFIELIKKNHTPGTYFSIEPSWLEALLRVEDVVEPFKLRTFVEFNGYRDEIEDLQLEPFEYPRLLAINVITPTQGD